MLYSSMNTFGQRLKAEREARGQSFAEFAESLGISRGFLSNLEKGVRKPSSDLVSRLAPILGLPLDVLQALVDEDRLGEERAAALAGHIGVAVTGSDRFSILVRGDPTEAQKEEAAGFLTEIFQLSPKERRRVREYIELLRRAGQR